MMNEQQTPPVRIPPVSGTGFAARRSDGRLLLNRLRRGFSRFGLARSTKWPLAALAGLALLIADPRSRAQADAPTQLQVPISTVRSGDGNLFVALYEERTWLVPGKFRSYRKVQAQSGTVGVEFGQLPPGRYAIAVFHDENNNGKIDTNFLGLPTEGYGFSRITPFRKPSFDETSFQLQDRARVPVKLKY